MVDSDRYIELLKQFPPRPIKSKEDYEATAAVVDRLLDKQELSEEESEYLDLLEELIYFYEQVTNPVFDTSEAGRLKYTVIIKWSDEDKCYLVSLPEWKGQKWYTHGDTYEEALKKGVEVIEILYSAGCNEDIPLPEPDTVERSQEKVESTH